MEKFPARYLMERTGGGITQRSLEQFPLVYDFAHVDSLEKPAKVIFTINSSLYADHDIAIFRYEGPLEGIALAEYPESEVQRSILVGYPARFTSVWRQDDRPLIGMSDLYYKGTVREARDLFLKELQKDFNSRSDIAVHIGPTILYRDGLSLPGHSGGGIVDMSGRLMGIHLGGAIIKINEKNSITDSGINMIQRNRISTSKEIRPIFEHLFGKE